MITFNIILPPNFVIDIGPNLQQSGAQIVSAITDLKAELEAKFAESMQASADEHAQVMGAVQALQDQLAAQAAAAGTPEELDAFRATMASGFDSLKTAIGGVFEPSAPPDQPPT